MNYGPNAERMYPKTQMGRNKFRVKTESCGCLHTVIKNC